MGGIISDIEDVVTGNKRKDRTAARDQASADRQFALDLWERQFGPVSDTMLTRVQEVLTPEWEDQFRRDLYESAGVGAKRGEQVALQTLKDKVASNPRSMSGKSFTQGVKDIQTQTGDTTSQAYASAKTQAKISPLNIALSFLGRTPFNPQTNWMPAYGAYGQPELARLAGSGLGEVVKYGKSAYNNLFGTPTPTFGTGTEGNPFSFAGEDDYAKYKEAASMFGWD